MKLRNREIIDQFYAYFKEWFEQSASCGENFIPLHNKMICIKTSIGNNRSKNQDRAAFVKVINHFANSKNLAISILADGMGGMASGEIAASSTIASFISYVSFYPHNSGLKEICRRAVEYSNENVNKILDGKGGSTLSAIVYGENGCVGVNIGDSRIYYYNNVELIQLSIDDTISGQLANNSENWEDPLKGDNRLAQFIGTSDELIPHVVDLTKYSEKISDNFFLLTSDGTHYIGKKMIEKIIKFSKDHKQIANRIVKVSEWLSGHDNSTIVICPNKISLNRIKTDEKTKTMEAIFIYGIGKETSYLVPKEYDNFCKDNNWKEVDETKKQKYQSEELLLRKQSKKDIPKKVIKKNKSVKKANSEKNGAAFVDLLPPEKK